MKSKKQVGRKLLLEETLNWINLIKTEIKFEVDWKENFCDKQKEEIYYIVLWFFACFKGDEKFERESRRKSWEKFRKILVFL